MISRRRILATAALAAVALAAAPRAARAQCMPDLLDTVPCCSPAPIQLPAFPAISQSSRFICFRDCAIQVNQQLCVDIDPPQPIATGGALLCGVYTIKFKVKTCGTNQILWQGNLRAHYARNWQEVDPTGLTHGVWRFLLNGDLKATAFLQSTTQWSSPNIRPACYGSFNAIYVGGYIDYAFDCASSTWQAAWCFNHDCDTLHHPGGSPRAGVFHATRSWTFVGPGAGFVVDPATTVTAAGTSSGESLRWNDWAALPAICRGEETAIGQVTQLGSRCLCSTSSAAPAQYEMTDVGFAGSCGSFVRTTPAPTNLWQKRIGRWTNPVVFPGNEELNVVMGDMDSQIGCNLLFQQEFFEGAATLRGWLATTYTGLVLGTQFIDVGSSNRTPGNMARRVGVPHVTQSIVNIDLP